LTRGSYFPHQIDKEPIFFPKNVSRITASFHSIMWKTTMSLLFPVTFICRFKKKWYAGQASEVAMAVKNESTAASMLYRASSTAESAETFTDGCIGITEDAGL